MHSFSFVPFTTVKNPEYTFFKVKVETTITDSIGNQSTIIKIPFDDFTDNLNKNEESKLDRIYGHMSIYSFSRKWPKEKFNHIEGNQDQRKDIYEFKNKRPPLRIYVCVDENNKRVFILSGSNKKNQKEEIKSLFRIFNDMPLE